MVIKHARIHRNFKVVWNLILHWNLTFQVSPGLFAEAHPAEVLL